VALEESLDLAEVCSRGRIFGRLDNCEAERLRAASRQTGGAPLDIGPDRIGDRAPLKELRGQTRTPI
jgi:hypothetical protein